ncbi:MAG TPA: DUF6600 domain-containing protein [Verrucomicrobiae bacterium]
MNRISEGKQCILGACLAAVLAWGALVSGPAARAQSAPANMSPDLQEIVKFAQAKMTDDVVLAYIKNSGKSYTLSGDDMIYLSSQGVSQAVLSALLQTKNNAAAPAPAPTQAPPSQPGPPPAFTPSPAPAPVYAPPPGLFDSFNTDGGLNPSMWMVQTPLIQSLAQWNGSVSMPAMTAFSPAGMQMSGVNGPGQFAGIQSAGAYMAPFTFTTTVTGLAPEGIPFEIYLVTPDLRQWLSVAGHLGGESTRREGVRIYSPFGGVRVPTGHGPSPEYGVWVNWTGSAQPLSALGTKIYPTPFPNVPYTVSVTVGADGMASVSLMDAAGHALGAMNSMPVGAGPFNVVLAARRAGPTFANWQSVSLTPLGGPQVAPPMAAPPETPTFDYFQAHLLPYGQWVDVPGVGSAWVPAQANNPDWRPYMDAGHWEYTDAGWFWQSDYPWGDIAFHYGRWINNDYTSGRWAWVPAYDWAPSWVAWREGEGGMGWAPLPWGVEFRAGLGLYWHGALVVDGVGFGLGFNAYCFVGYDHFWGGDYHHYAFDRERAHAFYDHSAFHAGYRMEGGRMHMEGLGREHMAAVTHHEVMEHRATEMRHDEERHDFAKRTEEHHDLARAPMHTEPNRREPNRGEPNRGEPNRGPVANQHTAERPVEHAGQAAPPTQSHSGFLPGNSGHNQPNSKNSNSNKKPN